MMYHCGTVCISNGRQVTYTRVHIEMTPSIVELIQYSYTSWRVFQYVRMSFCCFRWWLWQWLRLKVPAIRTLLNSGRVCCHLFIHSFIQNNSQINRQNSIKLTIDLYVDPVLLLVSLLLAMW